MSLHLSVRLFSSACLGLACACSQRSEPTSGTGPAPAASSSAVSAPSAKPAVAPAPARRRIVTVKTSLRPGGASEVVEIEERAGGASLRARRIHADEREESQSAELELQLLDELWASIRAAGLESAEAPEADTRVLDGISYMLLLEWPDRETQRVRVHSLHWSNPKAQPPAFTQLFQRVGALARARASKVALRYYGT